MENTHIDKIREFVNEHLTDESSLSEIAGYVGYSAFHLAREFKAITGVSIMEYTRDQRVFAAAKELETDRGVCEVAMEYCFDTHASSTKAFITVF